MSQPPINELNNSIRLTRRAALVYAGILLSACSKAEPPPYISEADHIFIAFGSVWGNGYEIELPKSGSGGSIFKQGDSEDAPENIGLRADINESERLFGQFSNALKPLEQKSTLKEGIDKPPNMGFDCENAVADGTMLQVIWFYPQKEPRYAAFYTGCMNEFTEKQWPAILKLGNDLERSVPPSAWTPSKARFVELGKWR